MLVNSRSSTGESQGRQERCSTAQLSSWANRPLTQNRGLSPVLALLILRSKQRSTQAEAFQQGLTLIECLVAVVVVSITLIAITPPIFFITATRVQNRKAEQALQVAQAEVDRVRAVVERGVYTANDLPAEVSSIKDVPAPTSVENVLKSANSSSSCNTYIGATVPATKLLPVNTDIDPTNAAACESQFLVQAFRTAGTPNARGITTGFRLGVRVYADIPLLHQNLGSLQTEQASLKFTSGVGNQNLRPLAILYSTVVRNDTSNALQDYRTICPSPSPTTGGC